MNYTLGDVCYWELYVDPVAFAAKHIYAQGNMPTVFITLAFDVLPSNMVVYAFQGSSRYDATNITLNTTSSTNFPVSNGNRVILIAYPSSSVIPTPSMLKFTYNITTIYYPAQGLTA